MTRAEIGVFLPQMGFTYSDILHRALRCEELGIDSLWFYDHLYGPGAPEYPSLEAWTLATAVLSRTERIQVGHMVLCNQFRHPAVLAKMATTLDQISAGRLQLGIGSGSLQDEHDRVGLDWGSFAERSERLGETLEMLHQAFSDERIDLAGKHAHGHVPRDLGICRSSPDPYSSLDRRSWSAASARSTRSLWWRATPTCGTCRPTRSANWSTRCRCCESCATTSGVIPAPS